MKFIAVDGSREHGSIYRSERYDLAHKVVGFGIVLVEVWDRCSGGRPRKLAQFTGHNALNAAMAWCQSHEDMDACRERHAQRETATHRAEGHVISTTGERNAS